jgi:hypothetical protein
MASLNAARGATALTLNKGTHRVAGTKKISRAVGLALNRHA